VKLRKYILTVTMVTVIILIAVLWLFPSDDDFHTDNPFWNGTKDVSLSCPVSPIASLSDLPASPRGALWLRQSSPGIPGTQGKLLRAATP